MIVEQDHTRQLPLGGAIVRQGLKEGSFQPATGRPDPGDLADEEADRDEDEGRFLLCARCLHRITVSSERIVVNGSHRHSFVNPHGLMFDLGCFGAARGCGHLGRAASEFTWFAGYRWQVAVCSACLFHLGWFFSSTGATFYGLIPDHLVESKE